MANSHDRYYPCGHKGTGAVIIHPYRPLLLPLVLIIFIVLLASFLPIFTSIDSAIIALVQSTPENWGRGLNAITHLGDHWILVGFAVIVALWQLVRKQPVRALVMLMSLVALPLFYALKQLIERARPVSEFVAEQGLHDFSFPSGHSAGSAAVYGMAALLAYSHLKGIWKYSVIALCVMLILLIGFSRVYIGAHFPTDVLGGWLLALIVISLLRTLSLYLARRSHEPGKEAVKDTAEEPEHLEKL